GVRCGGLAREMGLRDQAKSVLVDLVARDRVLACNRIRQQRIIIHGHGLTPEELPDGRRVLNAALGPERIQSARDAEPGLGSNVSFIDLSVIADRADGARGPVFPKAQLLAKFTFGPGRAPYFGCGG